MLEFLALRLAVGAASRGENRFEAGGANRSAAIGAHVETAGFDAFACGIDLVKLAQMAIDQLRLDAGAGFCKGLVGLIAHDPIEVGEKLHRRALVLLGDQAQQFLFAPVESLQQALLETGAAVDVICVGHWQKDADRFAARV